MTIDRSDFSSFGTILKAFRTRRGLTQQQLAEQLGVRRNTIGTWERGDFLPGSKGIVLELARHLRLDDQESRQLLEASLTALASHWSVPLPRNPFFTGREEVLDALHIQLGIDQAVAITQSSALHGLGGVGKTQIALEYAYRHALDYSAVFWIGAETEEQMISSLLHAAEALQLSERNDKEQQQVIVAVQRWLSTHSQWLVICDNIEDLELLRRFLPPARSGALLITTRHQVLGTLARGLDLLPMEQQEGMLFLLRRAKVLPPEATSEEVQQFAIRLPAQHAAATELVSAMGGLPLALDQAGAYLEETHCGLSAYLDLFRSRKAILLQQRGGGAHDHLDSVSTTFALAITVTIERHPAVRDLLWVCALLQPDTIPEELFRQGAAHLGPMLEAICCDELEWNRLIAVACSYSLLYRQPEKQTLSLHRLVQVVLYERMSEQEQTLWQRRVITTLNTLFPHDVFEVREWNQCERLLPHVIATGAWPDQVADLAQAEVLQKAANYLLERAQHEQAKSLYLRSLQIREQSIDPGHLDLVHLLYSLARVSYEQGTYEQTERFLNRAFNIVEQQFGSEHVEMFYLLNGSVLMYWRQGKYKQAEPLLRRALHIGEQAWGPEDPKVGNALNNLAILYVEQGNYEPAEPLLKRALHIGEQAWGPEHPKTTNALNDLGIFYVYQEKYGLAEPLLRKTLSIRERAWGPEHPEVARPCIGLANLYGKTGEYEQAEVFYQRALSIREQALGREHPEVAEVLSLLAEFYAQLEKDEQAESLYERALHIVEQTLGLEHPRMAISLHGLALLYAKQEKNELALSFYQRALSIREQRLGQHHPETGQILHDLAIFQQKQGNVSEACSLAKRALQSRLQSLGDAHLQTVATQALYAQLVQEQEEAEKGMSSQHHAEETSGSLKKEHAAERVSRSFQETPWEKEHFQAFLDACCELHPRAWCRSADLWDAYTRWAAEHQQPYPLLRGAFIAQLKRHGCRASRTMSARIWRGVALVKNEE